MEGEQNLTGQFLLAEPALDDPNFFRTVVLLLSHDKEGAVGLVINRPISATLDQAVPGFLGTEAGKIPLRIGGPVEPNRLFIINESFSANSSWEGGAFLSTHGDYLLNAWPKLDVLERPKVLLFAGYAGWGAGQLEAEIDSESWKVIPAKLEDIFHEAPSDLWTFLLKKLGGIYSIAAITGIKPCLN